MVLRSTFATCTSGTGPAFFSSFPTPKRCASQTSPPTVKTSALPRDDALIAVEDWHINSDVEACRVHVARVGGWYDCDRHFWKLRKNGRAHRRILALKPLPQPKKIKTL